MNIYEILKDPNLFLETVAQIPSTKQLNNISKSDSNYVQTRQKLRVINSIHNNTHTIVKNGRQVGITTLITLYIVYYCLTNTNKKILIFSPKSINVYHNLIFQTLNYLNFVHSYNFNYCSKSNSLIEINSNKIMISSNINTVKGTGIDFVYLDDFAHNIDDINVLSYLIPLLQYTKGKFVISSTPSIKNSIFNNIYDNSKYFNKIDFPNNNIDFQKRMEKMLDKEEFNVFVNAKIYPSTDIKNKITKN